MHPLLHNSTFRKAAAALLAVVLALIALSVWLGWGKTLDARHRPTDFDTTFDFDNGSLAAYDAFAQQLLRAAHPDLAEETLTGLAPFRLEPPSDCPASPAAAYRSGIVLTHDLLDSPYMLRELAAHFQRSCFVVYGLLLPAHGTQPGDLLRADWQQWIAAERFAARELGREVEHLYLGGHGLGGTLAILEAAGNADVEGLVLAAPQLDTRAESWRRIPAIALGWIAQRTRWETVVPKYSDYRYESRPWTLTPQANAVVQAAQAVLTQRSVDLPVFTVLSLEDESASSQAMLGYMATRLHPLSRTLAFSQHAVDAGPFATVYPISRPENGRLSQSHLSIVMPAFDPAFGRSGTDRDCGHYFGSDPATYELCMSGAAQFKGEITAENLQQGSVQRISYNPSFNLVLDELNHFIAPAARLFSRPSR